VAYRPRAWHACGGGLHCGCVSAIQVLLPQANSDWSGKQLIIAVCTWALCSHCYHCGVFKLYSRR
jgi:hypothetical protein